MKLQSARTSDLPRVQASQSATNVAEVKTRRGILHGPEVVDKGGDKPGMATEAGDTLTKDISDPNPLDLRRVCPTVLPDGDVRKKSFRNKR